jgi:hypothetical protein
MSRQGTRIPRASTRSPAAQSQGPPRLQPELAHATIERPMYPTPIFDIPVLGSGGRAGTWEDDSDDDDTPSLGGPCSEHWDCMSITDCPTGKLPGCSSHGVGQPGTCAYYDTLNIPLGGPCNRHAYCMSNQCPGGTYPRCQSHGVGHPPTCACINDDDGGHLIHWTRAWRFWDLLSKFTAMRSFIPHLHCMKISIKRPRFLKMDQ